MSCPACVEKYLIQSSKAMQQGGSFLCKICRARVVLPSHDPESIAGLSPIERDVPPAAAPEIDLEPEIASEPDPGQFSTSEFSEVHAAAGQELLGFEDMMPPQGLRDDRFDRDEPPLREKRKVKPVLVECPHCGNTFVPAGKDGGASSTVSPPPRNPADVKTILIVEDTEFFLQYAKDALATLYRPITARTAAEALVLLRTEPVKLVLLDLGLQRENDGLEVLAATAERKIPCIIFTARQESDLWGAAWEGLRAKGASDLLIKGMNVEDQLLYKVSELLGENPSQSVPD